MLRNRKGFTLIELLIVVVIIGILAAIALPKFGQTRERAYVSAMTSDLRNLQTSMEMHYSQNTGTAAYTYNGATEDAGGVDFAGTNVTFETSQGVIIESLTAAGQGWSAVAGHSAMVGGEKCYVYVGDATAPTGAPTGLNSGVVGCVAP
jgi:type IV pilus assembly protein PilA